MARCLAFSALSASIAGAVIAILLHISKRLRDWRRHETDGRKRPDLRLVQDLYQHWPGWQSGPSLQNMGSSYRQFCPVAKAMELLDERWTLLIVRELVTGSQHFNELRRGVPRMSSPLLSRRLSQLVRAGVVDRHDDGKGVRYVLTPAGRELRPGGEALGGRGSRHSASGASAGSASSARRTSTPICCYGTCTATSTMAPSPPGGRSSSSGSPICLRTHATGG